MRISYIQAIAQGFPGIQVSSEGRGDVYENLRVIEGQQLPGKEVLDAYMLQKDRQQKWLDIQEERDRRKILGVKVGTNWFHSDNFSRIQQMALSMMGQSMPQGIQWKTLSGTFVTMTPTLAGQIFQATAGSDMMIFAAAETKNAEMMALADPAGYDVTTGWPETYIPPVA